MQNTKEINIDVYGEIGCGKTTTALLIEKYFKNSGAYVKTQEIEDGTNPKHLDRYLEQSRKNIKSLFNNPNPFWGKRININIKNYEDKKEKEEITKFSIGDSVLLKGQNVPMIIALIEDGCAYCIWFDEYKNLQKEGFYLSMLKKNSNI